MKKGLFYLFITLLAFTSCRKSSLPVEFFLENEQTPFITDGDIVSYNKTDMVFKLSVDAASKANWTVRKNFNLRVGGEIVYVGVLWSPVLSSVPDGIHLTSFEKNTMSVRFSDLKTGKVDNRNDSRLLNALRNSLRLK